MMIIRTDGYDREGPEGNDLLICENVNTFFGEKIVNYLQSVSSEADLFKLVENNYKLQKFVP